MRLERQPMDLLILLVARRGELISRAEIIERLWTKGVFVDVETGINTAIRKIRRALNDSPEEPTFIETVAGKGYRFIADVHVATAGTDASMVMVAVLPFANLTGDPEREHIADGLTDDTIAAGYRVLLARDQHRSKLRPCQGRPRRSVCIRSHQRRCGSARDVASCTRGGGARRPSEPGALRSAARIRRGQWCHAGPIRFIPV